MNKWGHSSIPGNGTGLRGAAVQRRPHAHGLILLSPGPSWRGGETLVTAARRATYRATEHRAEVGQWNDNPGAAPCPRMGIPARKPQPIRICPPLVTGFPSPYRRESRGVARAVDRRRAASIAGCANDRSYHSCPQPGGSLLVSSPVGKTRRVRASGGHRGMGSSSGPGTHSKARSRARVVFALTNFRSTLTLPIVRGTRGGHQRLANSPRRARQIASETHTPVPSARLPIASKPVPVCQETRNVPIT
jgi:hypothetical protein